MDRKIPDIPEGALVILEDLDTARRLRLEGWEGAILLLPAPEKPGDRLTQFRREVEGFLREHLDRPVSMQEAARAMSYSEAYFSRLFKRCFGMNFSAYLTSCRMEKAKRLLRSTRLTVRQISAECGYPDPDYFARVFRRTTGQTPTGYRTGDPGKSVRGIAKESGFTKPSDLL